MKPVVRGVLMAGLLVSCMYIHADEGPAANESTTAAETDIDLVEKGMHLRVMELIKENDLIAAERLNQELMERYPDSAQARYQHGTILVMLNKYADAITYFETVIQKEAGDYRAMNNLAWLLATSSDREFRNPARALQLAQEAMLLAPGDYHVWSTLAEAHFVNASYDQAVNAIRQAIELARKSNAPPTTVQNYARQFSRLQQAAMDMALIE